MPHCLSHRLFLQQVTLRCLMIAAIPAAVHLLSIRPAEPVFCGDSNRHVMTSVFFRDLLADGGLGSPKAYAEAYFAQYPALGLLVWPPLFHALCGVLMLIFGTSVVVARGLILASLILAAVCVYRLARRATDADAAALVTIVFLLLPLIFQYGRDVMLEMPSLALCLVSLDQFDRWHSHGQRRALYAAAFAAALAALTRFDAVLLLLCYLMVFLIRGRWDRLRSWHPVGAAALAILLVAPVYAIILREMGGLHLRQAADSVGGAVGGSANGFLQLKNFWFYPAALGEQAGWPVVLLSAAGALTVFVRRQTNPCGVFLALLTATYLTFTPLAELHIRHAIYWLPATAFFAVRGLNSLVLPLLLSGNSSLRRLLLPAVYAAFLTLTACGTLREPSYRVEGYRKAAEFTLQHTRPGDAIFFDGWWDGNFTYHIRHLDPGRSRTVIRGDRLLYDFLCVPATDFRQHVETDMDILRALTEAAPKFVVIESPQFYQKVEIAQQLRELIRARPDLFVPQETVAVTSTMDHLPAFELRIFRFEQAAAARWLERDESRGTETAAPAAAPATPKTPVATEAVP